MTPTVYMGLVWVCDRVSEEFYAAVGSLRGAPVHGNDKFE